MCLHYRGHPHAVRAAGPGPCGLALASPPLAFIMDRERRYIGVPLLAVPPGSLASRSEVLRIIFSYNGGNMRGFRFTNMHCKLNTAGTTCSDPEEGCIAKGDLCIYRRIKAGWDIFPCISDLAAIRKIERLKARYDICVIQRGEDKQQTIEELATTFNFEAPDFETQIKSDRALSPEEKDQKLQVLMDYIGPEATR